jgi:hypothetical protein
MQITRTNNNGDRAKNIELDDSHEFKGKNFTISNLVQDFHHAQSWDDGRRRRLPSQSTGLPSLPFSRRWHCKLVQGDSR